MVRTSLLILALAIVPAAWAQDDSGSSTGIKKASEATPEEMVSFAATSRETVGANAAAIANLARDARNSNDSRLLGCITPKLTSAQALVQVVELSQGNLRRSLDEGGENGSVKARFEMRKIKTSLDNSTQQLADAKRCQDGEGEGKTGTSTEVTGGFGDDSDTVDDGALDDFDINVNPPQISRFEP